MVATPTKKRKRVEASAKIVKFKKAALESESGPEPEEDENSIKNKTASAKGSIQVAVDLENEAELRSIAKQRRTYADLPDGSVAFQIVTGSYERVLHGFSAVIPSERLQSDAPVKAEEPGELSGSSVSFIDTFLLSGHTASIRCLAVSPPTENDKRLLATGSSDERINIYSVSTVPPKPSPTPSVPSLTGTAVAENPRNKSLGSLVHHDRAITSLQFITKSKLFSAAEDNTIAISRSRDWTMLSSIKAPIPKSQGRPSGDTAAPGETFGGVNDFSVHPSQKLMLSVGRGERCMRLWNLMTGKKAGVLNFDRDLLVQVGEGKFSNGEGRRVLWDEAGDFYIVGFERGTAVFGIDSKPKAVIRASPPTKFHQIRFVPKQDSTSKSILATSTEDGRILFFEIGEIEEAVDAKKLPSCKCIAQLGGNAAGIEGRIKDFTLVELPKSTTCGKHVLIVITASSDGAIRLWKIFPSTWVDSNKSKNEELPKQVGDLVGTRETGNRINCIDAFVMDGKMSEADGNFSDEDSAGEEEEGGEDGENSK